MDADVPEQAIVNSCNRNDQTWRNAPISILLWILIISGSLFRFAYPFLKNPLKYQLDSDLARHYLSGTQAASEYNFGNIIDPVAYQVFLTGVFQITHGQPLFVAAVAGLISVVTPFLYYLWMRYCLPNRVSQLTGYAILTWLPGWICYSGYFMQESILLPVIGLSLWLTWRAVRLKSYVSYLCSAVALGLCANTKASAIALCSILWIWQSQSLLRSQKRSRALAIVTFGSVLILALCLITPLKVHNRVNVFMLFPQESFNRTYYESGKAIMTWTVAYRDKLNNKEVNQTMRFWSPSMYDPPFRPFSQWRMSRQGMQEGAIYLTDLTARISVAPYSISLEERLEYTFENGIYLLLADQYPVDDEYPPSFFSFLNNAASAVRWIWFPIVLTIVCLSLKRRRIEPVSTICLSYLFLLLIQQSVVMEGRYRMPWEGLAIVALLESLFCMSATNEGQKPV